ncbi:MAG: imidazole glycerol phosphate synthase subunit HisH [Saprospiraceae bacterium]
MTVIIDYGAGNTQSVINALERLGISYKLTSEIDCIMSASRIILPGVGHAAAAMQQLNQRGLVDVLQQYDKPLLGVCLGMQLLYEHSEEGDTRCLGVVPGLVKRFSPQSGIKVPHMGWNDLQIEANHPLFEGLEITESMYFVHSYYAIFGDYTIGSCTYNFTFSAAIQYKNFYGVQFHPEKSGEKGQLILRNFCKNL